MITTHRSYISSLATLLLAAFLLSTVLVRAAERRGTEDPNSPCSLYLNGIPCASVAYAEGGQLTGKLVQTQTAGKAVASAAPAPLVVSVRLPIEKMLADHIRRFLAGAPQPTTLLIARGGPAPSNMEAEEAVLTEVHFGALDASSKEGATLTLVWQPARMHFDKAGTKVTPLPPKTRNIGQSNFSVTLGNLPCSRITTVDTISICRPPVAEPAAKVKGTTPLTSIPEIPELRVSLSTADTREWVEWEARSLGSGRHDEANEVKGTITVLSNDMKTALLTLHLSRVGLISLARPRLDTLLYNGSGMLNARLYCDSIELDSGQGKTQ